MIRVSLYLICAGVILMSGVVSGCRTTGREPVSVLPVEIPQDFSGPAGQTKTPPDPPIRNWWQTMDSPELSGLIRAGLAANYDLQVRRARIDQARASLEKERAGLSPELDYSLGGKRASTRVKTDQGAATDGSHSWDGSLTGTYTVDVWGEVRAGIQARTLELEAARLDLNDAALDLSADIAEAWVDIISARNRLEILDSQIQVNQTHLDLQKLRFLNGRASALDVSQQRESLAQALSSRPLLEKEARQLMNELGFLTGETPGQPVSVATPALPETIPMADAGIPAALLENRSDVRAARMRLLASRSEVEAAKADLMPSFTLSASALFSSGQLDLLFENWVATLAAQLGGPLLDGGRRRAEVERTRAVVREQLNLYAQTVSSAIREVEDSLVGIDRQKAYIEQLEQELEAVRLTLKDARIQYLNGQSSYLNYLTAWTRIERLERQLVDERATYVKEGINLCRAVGWQAAGTENTLSAQNLGAN